MNQPKTIDEKIHDVVNKWWNTCIFDPSYQNQLKLEEEIKSLIEAESKRLPLLVRNVNNIPFYLHIEVDTIQKKPYRLQYINQALSNTIWRGQVFTGETMEIAEQKAIEYLTQKQDCEHVWRIALSMPVKDFGTGIYTYKCIKCLQPLEKQQEIEKE